MSVEVLGNRAGSSAASTDGDAAVKRSRTRRDGAWIIRALNQTLFGTTSAWGDCGNPVGSHVAIKQLDNERGTMQPTSIATCKSPWACLSCAGKIRAHRATEIDQLAKAHLAAGKGLTFITLTFPHGMTDSLQDGLETVAKGWRSLVSGSGYHGKKTDNGETVGGAKNKWGILGNIRAVEITDGLSFGWHPHLHVLCFHEHQLSPEDGSLQEFRAWWSDRWARWVKRTLGRDIHAERGVDAVPVKNAEGLGSYVSKIHYELVRSDLKTGRRKNRTPWQIALDAADTGDCRDIARWAEYCKATKGRWIVSGLPALRKVYRIAAEDLTDEQAAQETQDGTIVAYIDAKLWRKARQHRRTAIIGQALTAFETGNLEALMRALNRAVPDGRVGVLRYTNDIPHIGIIGRGGT